ncbi:MAG: lamin tail domain-containing protein [Candidatus Promineifilaceae bacterium]
MSFRRMLPFLLLNIFVSAAVVLAVLWWWDGRETEAEPVAALVPPVATVQGAAPANEEAAAASQPAPAEEAAGEEADRPGLHVVQAGDTLGQISLKYDIGVDAIMAANNISNPNFLSVGQELVIPQEGEALPEPADTQEGGEEELDASGAQRPTPIPTEPAAEGEALLLIADVVSAGQMNSEAVQIVNNGSREASLAGWKLTDQLGHTYSFGQLTLFGDGAGIALHTGSGQDSATDLYWGLEEALWNSGDRVVLYDAAGTVQAEFEIP